MGIGINLSVVGVRSVHTSILRAYRIAHILAPEESLTNQQAIEALLLLNEIIEDANIDKTFSTHEQEISIPLIAQKTSYTISPGVSGPIPDVVAIRPLEVVSGYARRAQVDRPVFVTHAKSDYDAVPVKGTLAAGWACAVYYQLSFPEGVLYVYPTPNDSDTTLHLNTTAQLATYTDLQQEMLLPPGYVSWLQYKLAYYLSQEYHKVWSEQNADILNRKELGLQKNNLKAFPISKTGLVGLSGSSGDSHNSYNVLTS